MEIIKLLLIKNTPKFENEMAASIMEIKQPTNKTIWLLNNIKTAANEKKRVMNKTIWPLKTKMAT